VVFSTLLSPFIAIADANCLKIAPGKIPAGTVNSAEVPFVVVPAGQDRRWRRDL